MKTIKYSIGHRICRAPHFYLRIVSSTTNLEEARKMAGTIFSIYTFDTKGSTSLLYTDEIENSIIY